MNLRKLNEPTIQYKTQRIRLPAKASEFPEGNLKVVLSKILQERALVQKGKSDCTIEGYRLLDTDEKTVVNLVSQSFSDEITEITLIPVRGYTVHLKKLQHLLHPLKLKPVAEDEFFHIMRMNGQKPGEYSTRIKVNIKPKMPGGKAMREIYNQLFINMIQNEQGIIKDIDTEYLHDFRIAIRKTRSALNLIKGVFPVKEVDYYLHAFSEITRSTNKLRDIDVYLLSKNQLKSRLPVKIQDDLEPFFQQLKGERAIELKKVKRKLTSDFYKTLKSDWQAFFNAEFSGSTGAVSADTPILKVVKKNIKKKYTAILEIGFSIDDSSPDKKIHNLRIQCKRLRYLLEFFSSLFPKKAISILVNNLKQLQDKLGIMNDLFVQRESLKNYAENYRLETEVLLAMGYLISKLDQERKNERKKFHDSFRLFSDKGSQKIMKQLF